MIRIRPTKGRRPTARSRCVRIILSAFLAAIVNLPVALNAGDDEDRYGSWFFTSDEVESTSLLTPAMSRMPRSKMPISLVGKWCAPVSDGVGEKSCLMQQVLRTLI